MTVYYNLIPGKPLTEKEKAEIEEAKKHPIVFDEDCPELSEAMLKSLKAAVRNRNRAAAAMAKQAQKFS